MRKERLVNFQNIAAGQVAILTCPIGPTYERFKINLTGGLLITHLDQIVGKINDKPFFTVSGADLLAENLYEGRSNPTTLVLLDFLRQNAKSSASKMGATAQTSEQMLTALSSALMQKLTFEFTINGSAPGGSNMVAFAQLNDPSKNPMALKQLYSAFAFPNAQDNDIVLAVGRAGAIIKKLYIHQSNYGAGGAGAISYMQVRNQGVIIWEGAPADAAGDQGDYGKVQQNGLTVVDFDLQGFREKWLNTALTQNVFLRLTTTGGPFNGRLYQSIVDPVQRA
ncbi:major capsid protein P2 [Burkholderia sp. BCC1988]|uniref:major capsid protein P2 n=1 Tax=Burkholderia sp. BCC1988 TaxID=2817443 RepID=UPI002AAF93D0|nr:major capsid protein P2 [Burkholderia sp. BCC1988]